MSFTVAIVTGAGRGMGYACARRLVGTVDVLVVVDVDEEALAAASQELAAAGDRVEAVEVDVTNLEGLRDLARRVASFGSLRAVAHAAGISPTMADWRRIVTVDLIGTARLIEALRPLVARDTAMVCFASMASQILLPDGDRGGDAAVDEPLDEQVLDRLHSAVGVAVEDPALAYAWAKRGVQRLERREAVVWGPMGGRICSISPGMTDTPQGRQEFEQQPAMTALLEVTPVGRLGRADDIAAVVSFLLSDEAAFVTGCDVLVDGGVCAALANPATSIPEPS